MQKLEPGCSINYSQSMISPNGKFSLRICPNGGGWFSITVRKFFLKKIKHIVLTPNSILNIFSVPRLFKFN